ncbi:MAG: molybdopterin-guanine dinucleotide biosynthesis protein MobA [Clostridiales bacterium]|jgi:molybdopterin-guanine dinucleotide biosynthesis protein A|nr:molybdopterin-guanine dinucleotide biosynthesis protein MobA [Clostridiales bacterium]
MLNAVVLAGTDLSRRGSGFENKALLKLNNKAMIEYVIEALKGTRNVEKIVVIGPEGLMGQQLEKLVNKVIDSRGSIMENVMAGVQFLGAEEGLLICSCDIPFITSEAINDFIIQAKKSEADLCYPIVERMINLEKFPEAVRTYVKLSEGTFTGGNLFFVNSKAVEKGFDLGNHLISARKKPVKMAGILGFGFLFRLLIGKLTIDRIEKKFSEILNIKAKAVISTYAEIGNDIDKPSDVLYAEAYLKQTKG